MNFVPIIFIGMGLVFCVLGVHSSKKYKSLISDSFEVVPATISDIISRSSNTGDGGGVHHYPVLSFTYNDGSHRIFSSIEVSRRKPGKAPDGKKYDIGDFVNIRIYASDVTTAIIDSERIDNSVKNSGLAFSGVGILLVIVGLVMTIYNI